MTGARRIAQAGALFALVLVVGATNASAQADEEYEKILPFIGHWDSDVAVPDGQDRGNCGGRTGDAGEKQLNCSMPVDQLPLNARGEAWLKYVDIMQSPTTVACAQLGLPALLTDGGYISASPGRVDIQHPTNPWFVARTVWLNGGGPKPLPGELHQHGLSTGRFDGDDVGLVGFACSGRYHRLPVERELRVIAHLDRLPPEPVRLCAGARFQVRDPPVADNVWR